MKTLDRYIFRELIEIFLLGLFVLMSILILEKINFLSESIFEKEIPAIDILRLITYISPAFLTVTIPLAILLASLVAFSRLSADNEIIAMRACGIGFYRILLPVLLLSILTWGLTSYLALKVQHVGNLKFIEALTGIISRNASVALGERVFFDRFPNTVIYINEKPSGSDQMKGIFISDKSDPNNHRIITASSGKIESANELAVFKLQNGSIYSGDGKSFRVMRYDEYDLMLDTGAAEIRSFVRQPREMSVTELKHEIALRTAKNETSFSELVEIYKRYSLPFSCLVLGLLGAPLGIRMPRSGKWGGMGIGIVMMIANYLLFILGEGLGREGTIHPALAMWLPNILMGSITLFLIYATSRETMPFKTTIWLQSKWFGIRKS